MAEKQRKDGGADRSVQSVGLGIQVFDEGSPLAQRGKGEGKGLISLLLIF